MPWPVQLGMRYKDGDGVPADRVEAYAWLSLASAQHLEDATKPVTNSNAA